MRYLLAILSLVMVTSAVAEVTFTSDFESGALERATLIDCDTTTYIITPRTDPIDPLRPDDQQSTRWFYFKMSGVKDQLISLEVKYTDVQRPMYSYDNINFMRFSDEEMPTRNGRFTKRYDNDSVYIAYFTPYTTERNRKRVCEWQSDKSVMQFTFGRTESGTEIPALVITDSPHKGLIPDNRGKIHPQRSDLNKKVVYIHGRIHPSESPSSWHLESLIEHIIEDKDEALCNTIFYVVPIINPEGVDDGLSRTNRQGVNVENNYNHSDALTQAEPQAAKSLIRALKSSGLTPSICLNMHSQSTPKLTYWIHTAESTSSAHNRQSSLLAALNIDTNPHFKWQDLSYSTLKPHFIEGWIYRELNAKAIALTYETPYSFYSRNPHGEWVTVENLRHQAQYTLNAIVDILGVGTTDRITVEEQRASGRFKRSKDNDYLFFGKEHLVARKKGAEVLYKRSIPKGDYNIYRWVVTRNSAVKRADAGRWEFVKQHSQLFDGEFELTLTAKHKGERFDKLLIKRGSLPLASLLNQ